MSLDEKANTNSDLRVEKEPAREPVRIVVIEDHVFVSESLRMLIESQDDMVLAAEAGTFEQALSAVEKEKPGIAILDLDLGGVNIVERIPEILEASEGTRVVVLTGIHDAEVHLRAIRLGALGLVLKVNSGDTVLKAVRTVLSGQAWIDRSMTASLVVDISAEEERRVHEAARIAQLSHREKEIVTVLCEGLSNKQIAERLFISEATVRNHITSILGKLKLSDRFELAIYSYRHGLAKIPH